MTVSFVSSTVEWLCCSNVASLLKEDEFNADCATPARPQLWVGERGRGACRCSRFRKRLKRVLNPYKILAIFEGRLELVPCWVEFDTSARGNGSPKLIPGRFRRDFVKEFSIKPNFLCLNFWQPVDGIERSYLLQKLRLHVRHTLILWHE